VVEGTPRNGVRTAVEDFLAETDLELQWTSVPGFCGVGILADERLLERTPALPRAIAWLRSPEFLDQRCRALELERLNANVRLRRLARRGGRRTSSNSG